MKYTIAYIDESPQWISTFYHSFKDDFEVCRIQVGTDTTIESILDTVLKSNVDGVVTDYLLDEEGDVDFNGNKIVEGIRGYKPHFPLTMITAHEYDAIDYMDDVHIIYDKEIFDQGNEEKLKSLKVKIKTNIDRYYSKIETTEKRIEELVDKRNQGMLEVIEEEELAKLFILMDELDPEGKGMPTNLISTEAITKLNDFVSQTKDILKELKKKGN